MVDPAADVVLLSPVALRGLVIVPRLLLWILPQPTVVLLPLGVLDSPLGAVVSIVPQFSTLEASVTRSRSRVGVPHRRTTQECSDGSEGSWGVAPAVRCVEFAESTDSDAGTDSVHS